MSELVLEGEVRAEAGVNFALIKYWGKAPARAAHEANLPAVPSLSLTLADLGTVTRARFAPDAAEDAVWLDGERLAGEPLRRVVAVLDRIRSVAALRSPFEIRSTNSVPTAAGLASSASGMAALAGAAGRCAGLDDPARVSELARIGSGSASRSVFGGWVAWDGPAARPLHPEDHWDLAVVVAIVSRARKKIGSRAAMNLTARTSPFYAGWVQQARGTFDEGVRALAERDLEGLVAAMEASTMRMHACAMGARPPILYWQAESLAAIHRVRALREEGLMCGWTMDAGPNVKVVCEREAQGVVVEALSEIPGVQECMVCLPGPGIRVSLGRSEG